MRRTDARLRRTDAHNLKYIIVMDMDGFDGYWTEFMSVLWILDGSGMVFGWLRIDFDGCLMDA